MHENADETRDHGLRFGVIAHRTVAAGEQPVRGVLHDHDGSWILLDHIDAG
ncbi:hypothetical protein [Marinactinospora rubrisoli]|uniref:Uncharacterized protein n=1 Tax=Marinactinospora rubrisoli TaxID=2715399 RepID=A0ABW2KFQ9_9ACTN